MVNPDCQVAVIGGGPAGARTAELLATRGISVLLFEAGGAGHEVLCSGLLNREAQAALNLELPEGIRMEPYRPLLEFIDADNRLARRFDPGYINMSRPQFDEWLRERATGAGARLARPARVRRLVPEKGGVLVEAGTDNIRARLAVDASGWRSISRKMLGVDPAPQVHAFQGRVRIDSLTPVMQAIYLSRVTPYYGWIVPKSGGEFLLGAGFPRGSDSTRDQHDDPWLKLRPFMEVIEAAGHPVELLDAKPLGHPITCISSTQQLWWGRSGIIPVGEAAGMVSPSSGDGISYCLQGAAALAESISRASLDSLEFTETGLSLAGHRQLVSRYTGLLKPALSELRFNIAKAWVAARPGCRGIAARFLPMFLKRRVESLAYRS